MDKKLKVLFDYQKFKGNTKLEQLIVDTESRYSRALGDDEIAGVSAAGEGLQVTRTDGDDGCPD